MVDWWWLIGAFFLGIGVGMALRNEPILWEEPKADKTDAYAIFNEVLEDD